EQIQTDKKSFRLSVHQIQDQVQDYGYGSRNIESPAEQSVTYRGIKISDCRYENCGGEENKTACCICPVFFQKQICTAQDQRTEKCQYIRQIRLHEEQGKQT